LSEQNSQGGKPKLRGKNAPPLPERNPDKDYI